MTSNITTIIAYATPSQKLTLRELSRDRQPSADGIDLWDYEARRDYQEDMADWLRHGRVFASVKIAQAIDLLEGLASSLGIGPVYQGRRIPDELLAFGAQLRIALRQVN